MPDPALRAEDDVEDAGGPMRLRCSCLVIAAPDDLRVVEQQTEASTAGRGAGARRLRWDLRVGPALLPSRWLRHRPDQAADDPRSRSGRHRRRRGRRRRPGDRGHACRRQSEPAVRPRAATASKACPTSASTCASTAVRCATRMSRARFAARWSARQSSARRSPMACRCELAALAEPFSVCLHGVARAGPLLGSACPGLGLRSDRLPGHRRGADPRRSRRSSPSTSTDATLAVARAMGANETIDVARDRRWTDRYAADKGTFDVMFECSGNERALRAGLDAMRPRGVVVQLGLGGDVSLPQNVVVAKELEIRGSFRFHAEFALAVRLINEGRVDMRPMVTRAFPIDQAREAFELASDRTRAMKVMLDVRRDGRGRALTSDRAAARFAAVLPAAHALEPAPRASPRTTSTGTGATRTICSASLPTSSRLTPRRPCVPTTIRSASNAFACSTTTSQTRPGSTLRQVGRDLDAGRRGVRLHLLQDLLRPPPSGGRTRRRCRSRRRRRRRRSRTWTSRMLPSARLRQADGLVEPADRRRAAVDRHEDALVHGRPSGVVDALQCERAGRAAP